MNWWFRHVFIDRNTPVNSTATYANQHPETNSASGLPSSSGQFFGWLKAKYLENAQRRYDWKTYKNLSDHQLQDIGLSRDDFHLLLKGGKPAYPQQRLKKYKAQRVVNPDSLLLRDTDLEKPDLSSCSTLSGNDCGEKAA